MNVITEILYYTALTLNVILFFRFLKMRNLYKKVEKELREQVRVYDKNISSTKLKSSFVFKVKLLSKDDSKVFYIKAFDLQEVKDIANMYFQEGTFSIEEIQTPDVLLYYDNTDDSEKLIHRIIENE